MKPTGMLRDADMRLLAALWRELAEAPAAQCDAALRHCLARLASHVGASNATWVAADREGAAAGDAMSGWRIRTAEHLHCRDERQKMARALAGALEAGEVEPYAGAIVRDAGRTRSLLRHELLDDAVWRRSWIVREALADERIDDRLNGAFAATPDCEAHLVLDRRHGERPFGERERNLLGFFLLGSAAFQRELLLVRGLLGAQAPLSARARRAGAALERCQRKEHRAAAGHRPPHGAPARGQPVRQVRRARAGGPDGAVAAAAAAGVRERSRARAGPGAAAGGGAGNMEPVLQQARRHFAEGIGHFEAGPRLGAGMRSSSRTTAAVSSTAPCHRSARCRRSSTQPAIASKCISTAACARARTCSRPWPSARAVSTSAAPFSTGWARWVSRA